MQAAYINENGAKGIAVAYDAETRIALEARDTFLPEVLTAAPEDGQGADIQYLYSTWGMPALTGAEIARSFPGLKAVFYAAGSVQYFARPFLERGIRIFSAYAANAEPVAEYASAQILLANKGFFTACARCSASAERRAAAAAHTQAQPGNYRAKVGILGAGAIGTRVIRRLQSSDVVLLVFDPFLPEEKARALGVEKASLERIFSECQTISCHLANNPQTVGMLHYGLFSRMKENATFINTGRGAQVVEADLARAMREAPERTAVLDVTYPEPPAAGHEFYSLPNVFLTPHIAGSITQECWRMGRYMWEDSQRYFAGEPTKWEVTQEMLRTMA